MIFKDARPTIFLLHLLGGSARAFDWLTPLLATRVRCVAVDLPGFGQNADATGFSVSAMVDAVAAEVRADAPRTWLLVGHSMGAKVATALARRAEDGDDGLSNLSRLILLAGSPPRPEPMDEDQRVKMLSWFAGDSGRSRAEAQTFIDDNVGAALPYDRKQRVIDDLLRTNRSAWRAWLEGGSKEDWSDEIGILQTPALLVAGTEDGNLGPDAQKRLMAPHFATVRVETLAGAGHLLPMERAEDVARLILDHAGRPT